jgi:hypothetical protein
MQAGTITCGDCSMRWQIDYDCRLMFFAACPLVLGGGQRSKLPSGCLVYIAEPMEWAPSAMQGSWGCRTRSPLRDARRSSTPKARDSRVATPATLRVANAGRASRVPVLLLLAFNSCNLLTCFPLRALAWDKELAVALVSPWVWRLALASEFPEVGLA